jgi:hypothetical protein
LKSYTSDNDARDKPLPDGPTLLRKRTGELVPSSMKPSPGNRRGSVTGMDLSRYIAPFAVVSSYSESVMEDGSVLSRKWYTWVFPDVRVPIIFRGDLQH